MKEEALNEGKIMIAGYARALGNLTPGPAMELQFLQNCYYTGWGTKELHLVKSGFFGYSKKSNEDTMIQSEIEETRSDIALLWINEPENREIRTRLIKKI